MKELNEIFKWIAKYLELINFRIEHGLPIEEQCSSLRYSCKQMVNVLEPMCKPIDKENYYGVQ